MPKEIWSGKKTVEMLFLFNLYERKKMYSIFEFTQLPKIWMPLELDKI